MKNKRKGDLVSYFFTVMLLCVIGFSGYKIVLWYIQNLENKNIMEEIAVSSKNEETIDFNGLKERNSDFIAWLDINGVDVSFPVVKTTDNSFYMTHNFDKKYNSAGWIFMDYRNKFNSTDRNMIIYGHNRRDGSMFSNVKGILDSSWYTNTDNYIVTLKTNTNTYNYRVFSVYQIEAEEYYLTTNFNSDADFDSFINTIKSRSIYNFGTETSKNGQILTISTCANNTKYRVVLHAYSEVKH